MPDRRWWESMFEAYERRWGRDWDANGSARRAGGTSEADWFFRMQRASCTPTTMVAEERRAMTSNTTHVLPAIQVPTLVISNSSSSPAGRTAPTSPPRYPTRGWSPTRPRRASVVRPAPRRSCGRSASFLGGPRRPIAGPCSIGCWRRCCSPISSIRPRRRPRSVTVAGATTRELHDDLVRGPRSRPTRGAR